MTITFWDENQGQRKNMKYEVKSIEATIVDQKIYVVLFAAVAYFMTLEINKNIRNLHPF